MEFVVRIANLARLLPAFVAGLTVLSSLTAQAIDADRNREYKLTKRHGPWMIMVASFKAPPPERRLKEGLTPKQAANELVYELRKKGIPAYTYSQDNVREEVATPDKLGRVRNRVYRAKQENYCVLAGNYSSNDESTKGGKIGKDTLEWIESRFTPEFLTVPNPNFERANAASRSSVRQLKSGGILRITPGKLRQGKGPLAGAFLTLNPLLTPEEVQSRKRDPLLIKLNSGNEMSLLNNPGKYTMVVASFYGKASKAQVGVIGQANFHDAQRNFEAGDRLDHAAQEAWQLATMLRRGNFIIDDDPRQAPKPMAFEAWVWHDRFRSVVTVGSFNDVNDPRIAKFRKAFEAKIKEHAQTRKPFLAAEQLTIPAQLRGNQLPQKAWIFDPKPQLVEVPRVH